MPPPQSDSGGPRLIPSAWHHSAFLCFRNLQQRNVAVLWAASIAVWCLGGGGHSGGGDNGSSSDSDARGRIAGAGRNGMTVCDGNKARVHTADNAGTSATAEQFALGTWPHFGPDLSLNSLAAYLGYTVVQMGAQVLLGSLNV